MAYSTKYFYLSIRSRLINEEKLIREVRLETKTFTFPFHFSYSNFTIGRISAGINEIKEFRFIETGRFRGLNVIRSFISFYTQLLILDRRFFGSSGAVFSDYLCEKIASKIGYRKCWKIVNITLASRRVTRESNIKCIFSETKRNM